MMLNGCEGGREVAVGDSFMVFDLYESLTKFCGRVVGIPSLPWRRENACFSGSEGREFDPKAGGFECAPASWLRGRKGIHLR